MKMKHKRKKDKKCWGKCTMWIRKLLLTVNICVTRARKVKNKTFVNSYEGKLLVK